MPTSNIHVFCRLRPSNTIEDAHNPTNCVVLHSDTQTLRINESEFRAEKLEFTFDRVFAPTASQEQVYETTASSFIKDAFEGYNCTIFAYGQTGSGKTHTMMGTSKDDGIIPRVVRDIFAAAKNLDRRIEFTVKASFVEIYNEKIKDLLNAKATNLRIRQDRVHGVFIDGITELFTTNEEDMMSLIKKGNAIKAMASTRMNKDSSRSHCVLILTLTQRDLTRALEKIGRLYLVDLAGSELATKTQVAGQMLEEAKMINKSLSALGNVITALVKKKNHVPYRDSKLTRLLQDSLGGNSKTSLIVTASGAAYNVSETISTLRFGVRAKEIKNEVHVNEEKTSEDYKRLLVLAQEQLACQEKHIQELEKKLSFANEKVATTRLVEMEALEMENQCLKLRLVDSAKDVEALRTRNCELETHLEKLQAKIEEKQNQLEKMEFTTSQLTISFDELQRKAAGRHVLPPQTEVGDPDEDEEDDEESQRSRHEFDVERVELEKSKVKFELEQLRFKYLEKELENSQLKQQVQEKSFILKQPDPPSQDWQKVADELIKTKLQFVHFQEEAKAALSREDFQMASCISDLKMLLSKSQKALQEVLLEKNSALGRCQVLENRIQNREKHIDFLEHSVTEFQRCFKDQMLNHQERLQQLNSELAYYKHKQKSPLKFPPKSKSSIIRTQSKESFFKRGWL